MAAATKARTADVARAIWKSRTVVVANVRVNDPNFASYLIRVNTYLLFLVLSKEKGRG